MSAKGWMISALAAGGVVLAVRIGGCLNKPAPDQRLAAHFEDLCGVARNGINEPVKGVRALGAYMTKHAGEMFGDLADTIVLIEKVPDDDAHDERARLARDRIYAPLFMCGEDWQRFERAIDRDPEATKIMERAMARLNRTIEILLGNRRLTLHDLPQQLMQLVDEPR